MITNQSLVGGVGSGDAGNVEGVGLVGLVGLRRGQTDVRESVTLDALEVEDGLVDVPSIH